MFAFIGVLSGLDFAEWDNFDLIVTLYLMIMKIIFIFNKKLKEIFWLCSKGRKVIFLVKKQNEAILFQSEGFFVGNLPNPHDRGASGGRITEFIRLFAVINGQ